jgi:hypothetical protein
MLATTEAIDEILGGATTIDTVGSTTGTVTAEAELVHEEAGFGAAAAELLAGTGATEAELAHEDEEIGFGAATEAELAHAEELTGAGAVVAFTGADAATAVSC